MVDIVTDAPGGAILIWFWLRIASVGVWCGWELQSTVDINDQLPGSLRSRYGEKSSTAQLGFIDSLSITWPT